MVTIVAVCLFAYFYNYCKYLQLTAVHFSIFARKTVVYYRGVLVKEFFKAFRISEFVWYLRPFVLSSLWILG